MVLASFFGAGLAADAFIAAFRIPNLLRRLFGEGSLSIAFVPVFTETMVQGDRQDGVRLAVSSLKLLLICLLVVAMIGMVAAPLIIHVVAPGFADPPEKMALTILLTRIMFPYIILIGLVALCMGILNVLGHFAAPAIAPVFLNLAMIGSVFIVSRFSTDEATRVIGLAVGVIAGGVLQLSLQLPYLVKYGIRFWRKSGLWHPRMRQVGLLMLPTIFGAAVYQINILVGNPARFPFAPGQCLLFILCRSAGSVSVGHLCSGGGYGSSAQPVATGGQRRSNRFGRDLRVCRETGAVHHHPRHGRPDCLAGAPCGAFVRTRRFQRPNHAIDLRCPFILCFGSMGVRFGTDCGLDILRPAGYPDTGHCRHHFHRCQYPVGYIAHGTHATLRTGAGNLTGIHGQPGASGGCTENQAGG
jgi:hypothetical protein